MHSSLHISVKCFPWTMDTKYLDLIAECRCTISYQNIRQEARKSLFCHSSYKLKPLPLSSDSSSFSEKGPASSEKGSKNLVTICIHYEEMLRFIAAETWAPFIPLKKIDSKWSRML